MDILFSGKKNVKIAVILSVIVCVLMIAFSEQAVFSAKKGISLWATNVFPAMLLFFICVNFLINIGANRLIPAQVFPFVMSVLSGYPMGPKIIGDLHRMKMITQKEAKRLVSFCSTSNPVFIVGAVGTEMLGMQAAGFVIAAAHYLGAICNGVFFSVFITKDKSEIRIRVPVMKDNLLEALTDAIVSAFKSLGVILAYIILFMFFLDMLEYFGAFDLLDSDIINTLLRGILEMTVGCSYISSSDISLTVKCVLASMIISWSGLSIISQSMSMLTGTGIRLFYLILTKLTHSIFAGIIALFLSSLML